MFTGLVESLGVVSRVGGEGAGRRIAVGVGSAAASDWARVGDSVAVNGCCLTVAANGGGELEFDVGPETLARTNLGSRRFGDRVNLERSLRVGDRLGGHFVQGHIDTTASLRERREEGEWEFLAFDIGPEWTELMVPKGSIAVDGVSLTLVDVGREGFSVMLIPHTLAMTNLGSLKIGERVNIETDILAKHVRNFLRSKSN